MFIHKKPANFCCKGKELKMLFALLIIYVFIYLINIIEVNWRGKHISVGIKFPFCKQTNNILMKSNNSSKWKKNNNIKTKFECIISSITTFQSHSQIVVYHSHQKHVQSPSLAIGLYYY